MKEFILLTVLLFVSGLAKKVEASEFEIKEISYLSVNSAITPATLDYLRFRFGTLPKNTLAVVKLNTPGGLVNTTRDIVTLIGEQEFPVAVWITPEGASASSAGAIIAASAHFILMSPGTRIGAATPVGLGDDIQESDGRKKALNDLSALMRSLGHQRGRPSAPFEAMVTKAQSFTDKEAMDLKLINGITSRTQDLKALLNGGPFTHKGQDFVLHFAPNAPSREYEASLGQKILGVLADPSTAYFLFLIGVALIYFEFQAPGGYIAGTVGTVLLILAAIAFQVLPLDWGALGLITTGIILLIMEVFITSYGILTLAGLSSFVTGSLFLFHGEAGFISVEYPVMFSGLAGVTSSIGLIFWYLYREQKKQSRPAHFFLPLESIGTVMTVQPQGYQVKVQGETWKAESREPLSLGEQVKVMSVDQEHLIIHVKKITNP